MLTIADISVPPSLYPPAEGLALSPPYDLDNFQKHAVMALHTGHHVFVTAKTGSGKTFVGEYLIARALASGKRVFYTTPIKSLSNQKYHDLKKLFPTARIGILTGDIKMCPDADVIIMTAEILRNLLYKRGTATESVGLSALISLEGVVGIVMDEVHFIQDPDRGHVWEETLIMTKELREIQLVLLSATMPSAESLASWIANLHQKPTLLVGTTHRVVPLVSGCLSSGSVLRPFHDTRTGWNEDGYRSWLVDRKTSADALDRHRKAVQSRATGDSSVKRSAEAHLDNPMGRLHRTLSWLKTNELLPALCFVFSRKECERLATYGAEGDFLDESSDAAGAAHVMDFYLSRHKSVLEKSPQYHKVRTLAMRGIGFHHSGLQPLLKEIVEILFARGFIRLLFATETFAVGLNMPTKTVIFLELSKVVDGGERRLLRSDEYLQMAGRAGRRGKDTSGLVLYEPMREPVTNAELKNMVCGVLPPLESRMRFHYDFILRQKLSESGESAEKPTEKTLASDSYWSQQQNAAREVQQEDLKKAISALDALMLTIPPYTKSLMDEHSALDSRVVTSKNAAHRKAQREMNLWLEEHEKEVPIILRFKQQQKTLRNQIVHLQQEVTRWDSTPLIVTAPLDSCLHKWGFLSSTLELTELGKLATEVSEGHNILMPLLAAQMKTSKLSAAEIVCVLAAFLRESDKTSSDNCIDLSFLPDSVLQILHWMNDTAISFQTDEDRCGVLSPPNFWSLSEIWVYIVYQYTRGIGIAEIAAEVGLFEGTIQRALLKVANLLEEWTILCELLHDLPSLEKIREYSTFFLRDDVIVDSLYLRL